MRILMRVCLPVVLVLAGSPVQADDPPQFPQNPTFSTLIKTPFAIEGLTGDRKRNLYTVGRGASPCPVWRINLASPALVVVGNIAVAACSPSGLAFNEAGDLFIVDDDKIYRLTPNDASPPTVMTAFASGVPGTNGLAFDRDGNLWTGDGTTGQGRVWKITTGGVVSEQFRVQPMRNSTALGGVIAGANGVGRQARTFPTGTLTITVPASASPTVVTPAGGQDLVANGLAFDEEGDLFIADTARGAIWRVEFESDGTLKSRTGCDSTFTANTLCLDNIFVAHPLLEGVDGIILDRAGNIWGAANERNAVVVVTEKRRVIEVFRNTPDATTNLRNTGPLETPTSPLIVNRRIFCTANSDGNRRDNSPNTAGEIKPAGPDRGKISCLDQKLTIRD